MKVRLAAIILALTACDANFIDDLVRTDRAPDSHAPPSPSAPPTKVEPAVANTAVERVKPQTVDLAEEARKREEAERAAFETTYPLHGVVYHYLAQVFAEPKTGARVVGYMRRGAQFRAKDPVSGSGCRGGWHQIPGDGYVCKGVGYQIGAEPQTFDPSPVPPSLDDALPYVYGYVASEDVPQYWRVPTLAEETAARAVMAHLRALDEQPSALPEPVPSSSTGTGTDAADAPLRADAVEAPPPPGQRAVTGATEARTTVLDGELLPEFLRMRMLKGFYVSIDRVEDSEEDRRFVRTIRGGYVEEAELTIPDPPTMRGIVFGGEWSLPVGFVFRGGTHRLRRNEATNVLEDLGEFDRHTPLALTGENIDKNGKIYLLTRDGFAVRDTSVRLLRRREMPGGIPSSSRWVHVDLSDQTLIAYEGDVPVFGTLVSTGKEGHETPTGLFSIQSKHVSTTMDDAASPDGAYSIEDVPWTMYFNGNIALHGAFWHQAFGRVRSHGCVNLAPADARWLFQWTTPTLPQSWHGIFSDRRHPGTFVWVTE